MNEDFNQLISRIQELYKKNPKKTSNELKNVVKKIENEDNEKQNKKWLFSDIESEKLALVIMCLAFLAIGLINGIKDGYILFYIFGLVFFLAGFYIGNTEKYFGLIFLFSHGGVGLGIMIGPLLSEIFKMPILSDAVNTNLYLYLNISILFLVAGVVATLLRNLSDNFKEKKYSLLFSLSLFFIGVLMIILFPNIYTYLI